MSDSTGSDYGDILVAVRNLIKALPSSLGLPSVGELRDTPILFEGETPPIILVCSAASEGERMKRISWNAGVVDPKDPTTQSGKQGTVVWSYPVLVVLIVPGNRLPETVLMPFLAMRQALRNAIFRPRLGDVASCFDIQINPKAVADLAATLQSNYRVTGFLLHYDSQEEQTWIV